MCALKRPTWVKTWIWNGDFLELFDWILFCCVVSFLVGTLTCYAGYARKDHSPGVICGYIAIFLELFLKLAEVLSEGTSVTQSMLWFPIVLVCWGVVIDILGFYSLCVKRPTWVKPGIWNGDFLLYPGWNVGFSVASFIIALLACHAGFARKDGSRGAVCGYLAVILEFFLKMAELLGRCTSITQNKQWFPVVLVCWGVVIDILGFFSLCVTRIDYTAPSENPPGGWTKGFDWLIWGFDLAFFCEAGLYALKTFWPFRGRVARWAVGGRERMSRWLD